MSLFDAKEALRKAAKENRRRAAEEAGPKAATQLACKLRGRFKSLAGQIVSGYLPIADEIDVVPALRLLRESGLITALPVVVERDLPLKFRRWTDEMKLVTGPLRTHHPPANSPEVAPDLLIVPMLAFDPHGYRIGWGGGFYDRTLIKFRAEKPVIAVGAAFSSQQVDKVPRDHHDARLDWIATEAGLIEISNDR